MKTSLLFSLVLAALAASLSAQPPPSREDVALYRFAKSPEANAAVTKRLLERFMGTSDLASTHRAESTIYYVSPTDVYTTFEHNVTTGDLRFHRGMARYMGDYVPRLPSREEALRGAEQFLKTNELLPRNPREMKLAHVGGLRASNVIDGQRAGPVIDKLVTLTFSRVIDSLPVIGPGSKLVLDLGEKAEVVSLTRHWRELDPTSRQPLSGKELFSPAEAEAMARRQIQAEYGANVRYEIKGSGKAYFDNDGQYLQPVYTFETRIAVEDEHVKPFDYLCVIPMVRRSPEPLQLTALDPKAKEMIKMLKPGQKPPRDTNKTPGD